MPTDSNYIESNVITVNISEKYSSSHISFTSLAITLLIKSTVLSRVSSRLYLTIPLYINFANSLKSSLLESKSQS